MAEMLAQGVLENLANGGYEKSLSTLYPAEAREKQKTRIQESLEAFDGEFGAGRKVRLFSAPGRCELGGNHTDHQLGRVLGASIHLDVLCVASSSPGEMIRVKSKGYARDDIDLSDLTVQEWEVNKSASLIRGIAARCRQLGYQVGGFDAYTVSNVLKGSGLSSSAAFEIAVVTIISHLFNEGRITPVEAAQIGQYAENVYFGKPSGLLDQMSASVGGIVAVDFADPEHPLVEPLPFDFDRCGHRLCVVDTGGSHADLTHEYAAIAAEMGQVAKQFGQTHLRGVDPDEFYSRIREIRQQCGDRAVLRAIHFFEDHRRVERQSDALRSGDFKRFKELVIEAGRSSTACLQNIYSCADPSEQGVSVAMALSETILSGQGAWRNQGGGFGGTIEAFVPDELVDEYARRMDAVFGQGACMILSIRPVGGVELTAEREA